MLAFDVKLSSLLTNEFDSPYTWAIDIDQKPEEPPKPLTMPPDGRYTAEWSDQLREAYGRALVAWRQKEGEAPAKALVKAAVHSWVYRARQAGALCKGRQGQAG